MTARRIAFVSLHTSPIATPGTGDAGGMNVVELHQAQELARMGTQVEIITRRSDPDLAEVTELEPGLTLRQISAGPAEIVAKSEQESLIGEFSERLGELGGQEPPYDVVHSQHWMSGVAALPVAQRWGLPHVQTFHSIAAQRLGLPLSEGEPPESAGRVAGEELVAQQSDLVVAVSKAEAATAIERCGAVAERTVVIPPGVDAELFRPRRPDDRPWRVGIDPYLVFAARLQPLKAPDVVIGALGLMDAATRPRLVLAGDGSPDFPTYAEKLHSMVVEAGLQDHVIFVGSLPRAELAQLMRGAVAAVVPSYSETFGLIALEAESCGIPVVAAHGSGGLEESVQDGVTGVLVRDHQPSSWAAALQGLLDDEPWRSTLGRQARQFAEGFSWQRSAQGLLTAYDQLIRAREGKLG